MKIVPPFNRINLNNGVDVDNNLTNQSTLNSNSRSRNIADQQLSYARTGLIADKDIADLMGLFSTDINRSSVVYRDFALDMYQNAIQLQENDEIDPVNDVPMIEPIARAKFAKRKPYDGKI